MPITSTMAVGNPIYNLEQPFKMIKYKHLFGPVIIPARPFLGMSIDDSQEVLFEIEEYLLELLMNAK